MRKGFVVFAVGLAAVVIFSGAKFAQGGQQQGGMKGQGKPPAVPAGPAPVRDLTGVWLIQGGPGGEGPGGEMPPMTTWAQAKYDANKPGYGPKAQPGGNDPILQCDPIGFPRIMYFITPFEITTIPGRTLMFFERDHLWREIWTDGRKLPDDPDPLWYGYSVGKWVDDYTFVVDSKGYDDRTWLGAQGQVHSDEMTLEETYHRVDHDTIEFSLTINDPMAYTKTWNVAPRILKLRPHTEIPQFFCVWSEENAFAQRIRMPAAKSAPK